MCVFYCIVYSELFLNELATEMVSSPCRPIGIMRGLRLGLCLRRYDGLKVENRQL